MKYSALVIIVASSTLLFSYTDARSSRSNNKPKASPLRFSLGEHCKLSPRFEKKLPTVAWEHSAIFCNHHVSYGAETDLGLPASDIPFSLPRKFWAKAADLSSRWTVQANVDFPNVDVEFVANNNDDLSVEVLASGSTACDLNVKSVQGRLDLDIKGVRVSATPRLNLETSERAVQLHLGSDIFNLQIFASSNGDRRTEIRYSAQKGTDFTLSRESGGGQEFTIRQQVDANNCVSPSIHSNGDVSVQWQRRLSDESSLVSTLKPDESLTVNWKDRAWVANINMPVVGGSSIQGAKVSITRNFDF